MPESFLTSEGAARLRAELEELTTVKRAALAARLRVAIQNGDLSENADYITAKEDQAFLEGRIQELETLFRTATIVSNDHGAPDVVGLGRCVTVQEDGADEETFTLVGPKEADPRAGRISHESPIGQALMGKRVGDTVRAETPGGAIQFKILKIEQRSPC